MPKLNSKQVKRKEVTTELMRPGNWFMFPKHYLFFLSPINAIVFSFIVRVEEWCIESKTMRRDEDGRWFYCTMKKLKKDVNINEDTQTRAFTQLRELGIIRTKMAGMPAKRYIQINWERVWDMIEENVPEESRFDYGFDDDDEG